mgnify:CR=1 FL=1
MKQEFWHERWAAQQIGFHNAEAHPMLVEFLPHFKLSMGDRVLVPLCGKTLDIHWLLAAGFRVVGVELVESAIVSLFDELGVTPIINKDGSLTRYSAEDIDIFVGDIFALTAEQVGTVDFVYDRAALVALPKDMRARYSPQVGVLSGYAPQMLIVFEYEQEKMAGPPFAIFNEEIQSNYGGNYSIVELARKPVAGKLKGQIAAVEIVRALHVG